MKKQIDYLTEFHTSFNDANEQTPRNLTPEQIELRYKLMKEENEEYLEAANKGDLVEVADSIGDMLYVALGTAHKHGMNHIIEEVFERIHKSNLSKLDENGKPVINGENGVNDITKPIGKILKGAQYKRVNLTDLI